MITNSTEFLERDLFIILESNNFVQRNSFIVNIESFHNFINFII